MPVGGDCTARFFSGECFWTLAFFSQAQAWQILEPFALLASPLYIPNIPCDRRIAEAGAPGGEGEMSFPAGDKESEVWTMPGWLC